VNRVACDYTLAVPAPFHTAVRQRHSCTTGHTLLGESASSTASGNDQGWHA
jgi:hypothetical protein